MITELKYGNTNTYLIKGSGGSVLFDTDWAGTFPLFCRALKKNGAVLSDIKYLILSHFHPDHMGIAQDIAANGVKIAVLDVQKEYIHSSDHIFAKEKHSSFRPVEDDDVIVISAENSREFLSELGINGELLHTPGHSDDSISLYLDSGELFVGDLNPLYELEMHKGTIIGETWDRLLSLNPSTVYYGHAKTAELSEKTGKSVLETASDKEIYALVKKIMKCVDRGYTADIIAKKTGADAQFIQDVARMYLTHQNVSVQGILDRIEIKNK